jgi:hypothetical protein
VVISGASIPAVSVVVAAIMPARCHQTNEAVRSKLPIFAARDQGRTKPSTLIANHSQLQQGTPRTLLNGIA